MEFTNNSLLQELEATKKELNILKEEYNKLKKRAINKQVMIDNNLKDDIISHLSETKNLTETAKKFECEPSEIFFAVPCWDDCNDRLYKLEDYEYHNYKIYGRENELYDSLETFKYNDLKEYNKKMRTPEKEELDMIISEYRANKHSLYELADKYNLIIINLFRLLKERKLIEKESDAIGFDEFYKEYIGEYEYNKYKIDRNLKLIEQYYYHISKN
jgi:hypothetical protein